ncbi:unnamed protein product [Acidithrix sp. C25]|nr:unnamed protein product [Acidithrix sp. C25]
MDDIGDDIWGDSCVGSCFVESAMGNRHTDRARFLSGLSVLFGHS